MAQLIAPVLFKIQRVKCLRCLADSNHSCNYVVFRISGSSDGIETRLRVGLSGVWIPERQESFLFSKRSKPAVVPIQSPIQLVRHFLSRDKADLRPRPGLRMNGALLLLPLYAFMVWTRTDFLWHLRFHFGEYQQHDTSEYDTVYFGVPSVWRVEKFLLPWGWRA